MTPGNAISEAEVSLVSTHGIWILLEEGEYFLPSEKFPWFQRGPVAAVLNVQRLSGGPPLLAGPRRRPLRRVDPGSGTLPPRLPTSR